MIFHGAMRHNCFYICEKWLITTMPVCTKIQLYIVYFQASCHRYGICANWLWRLTIPLKNLTLCWHFTCCCLYYTTRLNWFRLAFRWRKTKQLMASYQIRENAYCACAGNAENVSPPPLSDPDMHHGTCVTLVSWCMPGSLSSGFLCSR